MSTRGYVGIILDNGDIKSIYCHSDSHIYHLGLTLYKCYNSKELADNLINMGNASSIFSTLEKSNFYEDEEYKVTSKEDFICEKALDIEWIYLFDTTKNEWFVGTTWNDKKSNLISLKEALHSKTLLKKWFNLIIKEDCIQELIEYIEAQIKNQTE